MKLRIRASHPHGPGIVDVIAKETVMGKAAYRCKHSEDDESCQCGWDTEFYVFENQIVQVITEVKAP